MPSSRTWVLWALAAGAAAVLALHGRGGREGFSYGAPDVDLYYDTDAAADEEEVVVETFSPSNERGLAWTTSASQRIGDMFSTLDSELRTENRNLPSGFVV